MRAPTLIVLMLGLANAHAQPIELAPAEAFADALEAYSAGPFGEDITIAITRGGQTRRDRIRARIAPGAGGARAARFDLGTLHLHATGTTALAVDDRNPGAFVRLSISEPLSPDSLARVFRPVPLPSWELIARGVPDLARPVAFTGPVLWTSAVLDPDARPPIVTISGASARAHLRLVMLAETGRFKRLTVDVPEAGDEPATSLELSFAAFDPGPAEAWAFDLTGRAEAGTLPELLATRRAIQVGEPTPELGLTDLELRPCSWRERAGGEPIAIVLFRPEGGDVAASIERVRRVAESVRAGAPQAKLLAAAVIDVARFDDSTLDQLRALGSAAGLEVAWTASAGDSIELLAPGQALATAFINADGRLRAIVGVDGEASFSDVRRESDALWNP